MDSLPEELLTQICWNFGPVAGELRRETWITNRQTLYAFMCVNWVFHRAVRPVLYNCLIIGKQKPDVSLRHLLHICTKQPDTAVHIREIHFQDYDRAGDADLSQTELDLFLTATQTIDMSSALREDIQAGLRRGLEDSMIALLLGICRRLRTLSVEPVTFGRDLMRRLVGEAVSRPVTADSGDHLLTAASERPLQSLQIFRTWNWEVSGGLDYHFVLPFLELPSMNTLTGYRILFNNTCAPLPAGFGSILQRLALYESIIDPDALDSLLMACPDVREIDIRLGEADVGTCDFEFRAFGDVLRRRGSRIKCFKFGVYGAYPGIEALPHINELGDLTNMGMLHTLRVDWDGLCAPKWRSTESLSYYESSDDHLVNALPVALENLQLTLLTAPRRRESHRIRHMDRQIQAMMGSEKFQKLSSINLRREDPFSDQPPPGWHASGPTPKPIEWNILFEDPCLDDPGDSTANWICLRRDGLSG